MRAILLAGGKGHPTPALHGGPAQAPDADRRRRSACRSWRSCSASSRDSASVDVSIITGYLTELIEAFFGDGRKFGTRIDYRRETSRPWARRAASRLIDRPDESVLVINGDILTTLDFAEMYRFHATGGRRRRSRRILARSEDRLRRARVRRRPPRPRRLSREAVSSRSRSAWGSTSSEPVAWDFLEARPALADARPPGDDPGGRARRSTASSEPCYWLDIGRHDDYATANEVFESRRASFLGEPARPAQRHGPIGLAGLGERRPNIGAVWDACRANSRGIEREHMNAVLSPRSPRSSSPTCSARSRPASDRPVVRQGRHPDRRLGQHRLRPTWAGSWASSSSSSSSCSTSSRGSCRPSTCPTWPGRPPGSKLPHLPGGRGGSRRSSATTSRLYLRFKGGKGVATSLGAVFALDAFASVASATGFATFLMRDPVTSPCRRSSAAWCG